MELHVHSGGLVFAPLRNPHVHGGLGDRRSVNQRKQRIAINAVINIRTNNNLVNDNYVIFNIIFVIIIIITTVAIAGC